MSNLRHVVKRRVHLERVQPSNRQSLGMLEKHSDYKVRAKAYHRKQEEIKNLAEKARNRNKDEFNRQMIKQAVLKKNGSVTLRRDDKQDENVMKFQDAVDFNVLAAKRQSESKRIASLEGDMPITAIGRQSKRTLFLDEDEVSALHKKKMKRSSAESDEESSELVKKLAKRRKLPSLEAEDVAELLDTDVSILDGSVGLGISKEYLKNEDLSAALAPKEEDIKEQIKSLERIKYGQDRVDKLQSLMERLETKKMLRAKGHKEFVGTSADGKNKIYRMKAKRQS